MVPAKPRAHQGPGAPLPPQSIVQFVTASSAQHYPVRASCQPLPATGLTVALGGFGLVRVVAAVTAAAVRTSSEQGAMNR
jgi:hypothetical protein